MQPATPPLRFTFSTVTDVQRVTIYPDGIGVETRDLIGTWQPGTRAFWDEIRAVYSWTAPNWSTVVVGVLLGLVLAPFVFLGVGTGSGLAVWLLLLALVTAASLLLATKLRPRIWYRVESTQPTFTFHTRRPEVLPALLSHLDVVRETPVDASEPWGIT
jgi:hypothetical protein